MNSLVRIPSAPQRRIVELLDRLVPNEGTVQSLLDGVKLARSSRSAARMPVLYEPSIVIVCQGRKRGFLGDQVYVYDANHYLVLSVPLPFECETQATPEEPLLAVSLRIDFATIAELLLALDQSHGAATAKPAGICSTPLDEAMHSALVRLLEALCSPTEARILGPAIVRELLYRVLTGEQGDAIRSALTRRSYFGQVARALRRIHSDYHSALDVQALAQEAGMSAPAFHARFKEVTAASPMQYLKMTRLHQARLLMLQEGAKANGAAVRVGYESASQFSRDFKRLFGRSPKEEVEHLRAMAMMPAVENLWPLPVDRAAAGV